MKLAPELSLIITLICMLLALVIREKKKQAENKTASKKRNKKQVLTKQELTASEITNVLDIKDKFLYGRDGTIFTYLKINPVSLDLLSDREKEVLSSVLSAELSRETKPFKLIALSRPIDITPLLDEYTILLGSSSDEKQKELLRLEMNQMRQYMNSGEVVQRQFFIAIWDKYAPGCETDMLKRTKDFALSFQNANVGCEILNEDGIITLCNLINNPAFIHLEDTDYRELIPTFNRKEEI